MASKAYEFSMTMETPFNVQKWDVNPKENTKIRRSLTTQARVALAIAVFIVTMIVVVLVVCFFLPQDVSEVSAWPTNTSKSRLGKFSSAAISTDSPPCAPIGKDILLRNGTAVDAAVAMLVCMGAYNPPSMGLGGGFLMVYYNRTEKKAHFIDAREVAPLGATRDMFHGNATLKRDGGLAIAVPGELAGYAEAHRRFGRLPWRDLFTPTIRLCKEGFKVSRHLARAIQVEKDVIMQFKDIRDHLLKNGTEAYQEGELLRLPILAQTLETISKEGMRALYGPSNLSDSFLEDLKRAGSIITKLDLQNYSPRLREPVEVKFRDLHTLYSSSIPGSGALLGFMLAVLGGYCDLDRNVTLNDSAAVLTYHRVTETFKFAYAHRNRMEDEDSPEMEELMKKLKSPAYADDIRNRINDFRTHEDLSYYGENLNFTEDSGTAHVSIVAPNGDAVSVTSTINTYFGSKIISPSTGIILNNEMDDFSAYNIINYFDVMPTTANSVRPGKRPLSSMTPSIVVDASGDVRLVIGGNGGTSITTGALEVSLRNLFIGEDIKQSIDAPRMHHQLIPNVLQYEHPFPEKMIEGLRNLGHIVERRTANLMSIMMGIARGEDGHLYANADFRKGGDVDGF